MAFKYENAYCPTCDKEVICECDDVTALGMVEHVGPGIFASTGETVFVMWSANEATIRVFPQRRVTAICMNRHFWSTVKTYVPQAEDAVAEPKWVGNDADDAERALHRSSRKHGDVLGDMGKFTVATLDWDGNLLLYWVEAEDGDAAVAAVSLHVSPMEFLATTPGLVDEAELRRRHSNRTPLRKYTVTGKAEDGRPIYEWVESHDGLSAVDKVSIKFGKFEPHVVVPGHHKPLELEAARSEDAKELWANSVVDGLLN